MQKYLVISLIFFILVAAFVALNIVVVPINLVFARFDVSLAFVILGSVLLGACMMFFLNLVDKFKKRSEINQFKKQIAQLEQRLIDQRKEMDSLRYPVTPPESTKGESSS